MMNKRGQSFQVTFYSFMLLALVVLGLFSFTFYVQRDNDAEQPLANNPLFNQTATRLGTNITGSETSSKVQQGVFSNEQPREGFGSITLFSILSAGKTFTGLIYDFFGVILRVPMVVLGIDSTIVSAFITILIVTIIIGLWIVYKIGG